MLRDGTSGDWIGTFVGHKGAVWSCQLDPTGSLAATASGDYSVKVWDGITGKELHHFAHHQHIVKSCEWSPNSLRLVTGGREGVVRIYDMTHPHNDPWEIVHTDASENQKVVVVTKCGWLSDTCVVTGGDDGKIRFWDVPHGGGGGSGGGAAQSSPSPPPSNLKTAPPTHVLETDEGAEIRDFELKTTNSGQQILTVAAGTKVYFFDLQTYERLHAYTMPIHFRAEGGASLHPSGSTFVAGGSDLWVRVYDFHTGRELECLKGHHGPIRCLRYAPDGRTFASGSEDGTIRLWKSDPVAATGGAAAGADE